jgi:hypothetical protein
MACANLGLLRDAQNERSVIRSSVASRPRSAAQAAHRIIPTTVPTFRPRSGSPGQASHSSPWTVTNASSTAHISSAARGPRQRGAVHQPRRVFHEHWRRRTRERDHRAAGTPRERLTDDVRVHEAASRTPTPPPTGERKEA